MNTATAELNSVTSFVIVNCIELHKWFAFYKENVEINLVLKKGAHTKYKLIHKSHSQILILQNKICLQKSTKPFLCFPIYNT